MLKRLDMVRNVYTAPTALAKQEVETLFQQNNLKE
jgi:hypothetical protein